MADRVISSRLALLYKPHAEWEAIQDRFIPKAGEVCFDEFETGEVKFKVGDGTKTLAELDYFGGEQRDTQIFEIDLAEGQTHEAAIEAATTDKEVVKGDIAIIKAHIAGEDDAAKYEYTAYVFNGSAWAAMDGNYSADNVYFENDLVITKEFGRYTIGSSGSNKILSAGMSLRELLEDAYSEETKTGLKTADPAAFLSGSIKYYEIGSTGTQDVTVSLSADGEYKYGYSTNPTEGSEGDVSTTIKNDKTTGVVVDNSVAAPYSVIFNGSEVEPKADKGAVFTLAPAAQLAKAEMSATGTVYHTQGGVPVSNLGKMYPSQRIPAGSKSTSAGVRARWYIPMFQGFTYAADAIADPANITKAQIEALNAPSASTFGTSKKIIDANAFGSALANKPTKPTTATATKAWRQYFVAIPADYGWTMSGAKDGNNIDCTVRQAANVTMTYGSGDNTVDVIYNVYYIHNAADYGTLKISWTM